MIENFENLVLEHLRALRADVSSIKADVRDLKLRMSSMESIIVRPRGIWCESVVKQEDV